MAKPSAGYSLTVTAELVGEVTAAALIGCVTDAGAEVTGLPRQATSRAGRRYELTAHCADDAQAAALARHLGRSAEIRVLDSSDLVFARHAGGKLSVWARRPLAGGRLRLTI